jgi:hypothetical protein
MTVAQKEQAPKKSYRQRFVRWMSGFRNGPALIKGEPTPPSQFSLTSPYQRRQVGFNAGRTSGELIADMDAVDEGAREEKALALEEAKFELTKESLQRNLTLVHRSVMISMLTSMIALAALIAAIFK